MRQTASKWGRLGLLGFALAGGGLCLGCAATDNAADGGNGSGGAGPTGAGGSGGSRGEGTGGSGVDAGSDGATTADANKATCSFTACGGDPAAVWKLLDVCAPAGVGNISGCAQAQILGDKVLKPGGKLTIVADKTFSDEVATQYETDFTIPASCLSAGQTCEAFGMKIQTGGPTTNACTAMAPAGCFCSLTTPPRVAGTGDGRPGTWSISVNTLVFLHSPNDKPTTTMLDYCVEGNVLKMRDGYGQIFSYQRM